MKNILPEIDTKKETEKITNFIQKVLKEQGFKKVVIGISGGIDSATSFYLLKKTLQPNQIIPIHMPYGKNVIETVKPLLAENSIRIVSIKPIVDEFKKTLQVEDALRLGNIMARTRMITLFDIAKKEKALVCGTENKSEHYLSYFTRFGDEASDFEPIRHLYKTQVYQLAKYLNVPTEILNVKPSAGLWKNQSDEDEFGFSYKEADQVLYGYFELKKGAEKLEKEFKNANKIISWAEKNEFKHRVPYLIETV